MAIAGLEGAGYGEPIGRAQSVARKPDIDRSISIDRRDLKINEIERDRCAAEHYILIGVHGLRMLAPLDADGVRAMCRGEANGPEEVARDIRRGRFLLRHLLPGAGAPGDPFRERPGVLLPDLALALGATPQNPLAILIAEAGNVVQLGLCFLDTG